MPRGAVNKTAALERLIKDGLAARVTENPRHTAVQAGYELQIMKAELSKLRRQAAIARAEAAEAEPPQETTQ